MILFAKLVVQVEPIAIHVGLDMNNSLGNVLNSAMLTAIIVQILEVMQKQIALLVRRSIGVMGLLATLTAQNEPMKLWVRFAMIVQLVVMSAKIQLPFAPPA